MLYGNDYGNGTQCGGCCSAQVSDSAARTTTSSTYTYYSPYSSSCYQRCPYYGNPQSLNAMCNAVSGSTIVRAGGSCVYNVPRTGTTTTNVPYSGYIGSRLSKVS